MGTGMSSMRVTAHLVLAGLLAAGSSLIVASPAYGVADTLSIHRGLLDLDRRTGSVAPTTAQLDEASTLNAEVIWNRFGTPQSLINHDGYLGTGYATDPIQAARSWVNDHRTLLRLSQQDVGDLDLVNDSRMVGSSGHAVLFRQTFGGLTALVDGMITVGGDEGQDHLRLVDGRRYPDSARRPFPHTGPGPAGCGTQQRPRYLRCGHLSGRNGPRVGSFRRSGLAAPAARALGSRSDSIGSGASGL